MDRRSFLRTKVSGSFLVGMLGGAAATAAGAVPVFRAMSRSSAIGLRSYAQQGEDVALWQMAHDALGIEKPTYLDVGANDPVVTNNTYFFYERGCRGVLVEPNPDMWGRLSSVRPGDVLLRAGIGAGGKSIADYYVINGGRDGVFNTFSKEDAEGYAAKSRGQLSIKEVIKMPLLDINEVMREHWNGPPNVLSIDTEGFDFAILKSIEFKRYRPDVICVETLVFGSRKRHAGILELMAARDYEVRGGSFVNTIFLDKRHLA